MPAYDATRFEPPAPLARVILRNPDTSTTWSDVPMLLDSGADVTLIPQTAVKKMLGHCAKSEICEFAIMMKYQKTVYRLKRSD